MAEQHQPDFFIEYDFSYASLLERDGPAAGDQFGLSTHPLLYFRRFHRCCHHASGEQPS
jgi:hypothetical protein